MPTCTYGTMSLVNTAYNHPSPIMHLCPRALLLPIRSQAIQILFHQHLEYHFPYSSIPIAIRLSLDFTFNLIQANTLKHGKHVLSLSTVVKSIDRIRSQTTWVHVQLYFTNFISLCKPLNFYIIVFTTAKKEKWYYYLSQKFVVRNYMGITFTCKVPDSV